MKKINNNNAQKKKSTKNITTNSEEKLPQNWTLSYCRRKRIYRKKMNKINIKGSTGPPTLFTRVCLCACTCEAKNYN